MASEIRGHLVQPWAALGSKSPDATKGPGRGGEGLSPFAKRDPWGGDGSDRSVNIVPPCTRNVQ